MTVKLAILTVALGLIGVGATGAASAQAAERGIARSDLSAPSQTIRARARARIRVTPRCPYRLESLPYPTPYECEYPGPGFVRQCTAQLVREYRPSGTVIVPVMRCWWERG